MTTHLAEASGSSSRPSVQSLYNGTVQKITSNNGSQASSAFATSTTVIRLVAKAAIYYKIGKSPTADNTGTSTWLPANVVEFPQVCRGDSIAVIQDTAGGEVNITEMI